MFFVLPLIRNFGTILIRYTFVFGWSSHPAHALHPKSSQEAARFLSPHIFISSSFAHLIPNFFIFLLLDISVSGNFPFLRNMILNPNPTKQNAMRMSVAMKIFILLIDKACAYRLVVINLINHRCKNPRHRAYGNLALVVLRLLAQRNRIRDNHFLKRAVRNLLVCIA